MPTVLSATSKGGFWHIVAIAAAGAASSGDAASAAIAVVKASLASTGAQRLLLSKRHRQLQLQPIRTAAVTGAAVAGLVRCAAASSQHNSTIQ